VALGTEEVVDRFVGTDSDVTRVFAQKPARKNGRGQQFETILFEGVEVADADLGRVGDLAQVDVAHLALTPQPGSEGNGVGIGPLFPGARLRIGSLGRLAHG
jgi:hypothetical protein